MDWEGFSKEDINKIKMHQDGTLSNSKNNINPLFDEKLQSKSLLKDKGDKTYIEYPIPPDARLSKMINHNVPSLEKPPIQNVIENENHNETTEETQNKTITILVAQDKSYEVIPINEERCEKSGKVYLLESSSKYEAKSKTSLELFQEKQKQMEEQNKRRKDILTKAIADKKRQTQSEAKKLIQIQEELNRLDALLSTDVRILRDQIEIASAEFNEAQKRYDRAESEFIESKMNLFGKLERKELLTEHLCRIIEVNEQRKAQKLSELMTKLEILDDQKEEVFNLSVLPQTGSLDEISYAACTTLKNPCKNAQSNSECVKTSGANYNTDLSIQMEQLLNEKDKKTTIIDSINNSQSSEGKQLLPSGYNEKVDV